MEPRNKEYFYRTVKRYEQDCSDKDPDNKGGAVLFAVCRGKLAEGVDLSDEKSRGVILVGIPYSYPNDPLVAMKMEYLDRVKIGGKAWYQQTAFRAVNQALGRAIRHGGDYGAMIFLDERFAANQNMLPAWVSAELSVVSQFGSAYKATSQFFKFHAIAGSQKDTYSNKFKLEDKNLDKRVAWFDFPILSKSFSVLSVVIRVLFAGVLGLFRCFMFLMRNKH